MPTLAQVVASFREHPKSVILPLVDEYLISQDDSREPDQWVHPSAIPALERLCARALLFSTDTPLAKVPSKILGGNHSPRTKRIFHTGHAVHRRYQAYMIESGIVRPELHKGYEIPVVDERLNVKGHADAIAYPEASNKVKISYTSVGSPVFGNGGFDYSVEGRWRAKGDPVLVEIKSIYEAMWSMLATPLPNHVVQATAYAALLKIKNIAIIYECKNTQKVKEFFYPFNQNLWAAIHSTLVDVQRHRKKRSLPSRVCSDPFDPIAKKCQWSSLCFTTHTYQQLVTIDAPKTTKRKETVKDKKASNRARKGSRTYSVRGRSKRKF